MAGWQDGRMAGWQDGRMTGWQDGRMAEWQNGRICQDGTMDLRRMALHLSFNELCQWYTNLLHPCYLQYGRAGITIMHLSIAGRYFSRKNSTNMMPEGSALVICHCRRVLLDALQYRETRLLALRSPSSRIVYENGDKFHRRNSMWVVN